jgi:transposase
MIIIGCDYHPGFQQIAYVDTDTGELSEARLGHKEQAEQFYNELSKRGIPVRVGMEASGHARWFERLLNELQFELWIGECSRDPHQTSTQAEDRSPGCAVAAAAVARRSLSANLGI